MSDNSGAWITGKIARLLPGTKCVGVFVFLLGAIAILGVDQGLSYTNTTEFCTSCHSQQFPFEEYKQSAHYTNVSGVRAGCADCHVPKSLGPKLLAKVMAAKDVYHELAGTIDTAEKFESHRWTMANRVWDKMRATDSRECRSCHTFGAMNIDSQDKTARKKHRRAREDGETCIECHTGVAHEEPLEPAPPSASNQARQ
jgi:nitrate/TMAO reductase-like tetraheme cytochrome c subunit